MQDVRTFCFEADWHCACVSEMELRLIAILLTMEQLANLLDCEQLSFLSVVVRHMAAKPTPKDDRETLFPVSAQLGSCLDGLHTAFCISLDHMLLYL